MDESTADGLDAEIPIRNERNVRDLSTREKSACDITAIHERASGDDRRARLLHFVERSLDRATRRHDIVDEKNAYTRTDGRAFDELVRPAPFRFLPYNEPLPASEDRDNVGQLICAHRKPADGIKLDVRDRFHQSSASEL